MARKNRDIWNKNSIELTKGEITKELDLILRKTGELECLHYILEKIKLLEDSNDPSSLQRRFLYILSGLHHNKLFGGLGKKQIADLASLAQTILFVSEIKPSHSTVSFLYSELHNTISDIYYSKGEYLPSVWERMLGTHIASLPVEQLAQQSLNMGINVLRLGNSALALEYFGRGINQSPDSNILDQLRLNIVRTTRLSGKLAEAENLLQELTPLITNSLNKLEFDWEKFCLNASLNGDLVGLFFLTKKTSPLYTSSKMLELFFWSYAHSKTQWSQRLNKLSTLVNQRKLDFQRQRIFLNLAFSIEQAYDSTVPLAKRQLDIKRLLTRVETLPQIECTLLVWLALTRWLVRSHNHELAGIIFYEYRSLSQKLSGGQTQDVLGLASDLLKVDWLDKAAS